VEIVEKNAEIVNRSPRTLYRWAKQGIPKAGNRDYVPSDYEVDLYYENYGSVAAVHRTLGKPKYPTLRTLQRAFKKHVVPAERAYVKEGEAGRRRHALRRQLEPEHRNDEWQIDAYEVPVEIVSPGRGKVKPWLVSIIDGHTRAIVGYRFSAHVPTQTEVLDALHMAIDIKPNQTLGGAPDVLRCDNGLQFLADSVKQATAALHIALMATAPYSPHLKGKIERVQRTYEQELFSTLPFYRSSARRADGRRYWPDTDKRLGLTDIEAAFADWVDAYNYERAHSALDGDTPMSRWDQDVTTLRTFSRRDLHFMCTKRGTRLVRRGGVLVENYQYLHDDMLAHSGESVDVAFRPNDPDHVHIFEGDRFICTALKQDDLTPEEQRRWRANSAKRNRQQGARRRKVTLRQQARLAASNESPDEGVDDQGSHPWAAANPARGRSSTTSGLLLSDGPLNRPLPPREHGA
jgi:putative transposase